MGLAKLSALWKKGTRGFFGCSRVTNWQLVRRSKHFGLSKRRSNRGLRQRSRRESRPPAREQSWGWVITRAHFRTWNHSSRGEFKRRPRVWLIEASGFRCLVRTTNRSRRSRRALCELSKLATSVCKRWLVLLLLRPCGELVSMKKQPRPTQERSTRRVRRVIAACLRPRRSILRV